MRIMADTVSWLLEDGILRRYSTRLCAGYHRVKDSEGWGSMCCLVADATALDYAVIELQTRLIVA